MFEEKINICRLRGHESAQATVIQLDGWGTVNAVLYSYSTLVAAVIGGVRYKTSQFWSVTTSKHINWFFQDYGRGEIQVKHPADLNLIVKTAQQGVRNE